MTIETLVCKDKNLRYHETSEDVDTAHMKDCLRKGILVSYVKYLPNNTFWYEIYEHNEKGVYDIESNRIDTPEKIVFWISQLCGKCWITREHIRQLLGLLQEQEKFKHRCY